MAESPAHLRLEAVSKSFGGALAVDHVSLQVPRGAFATLLGPSGCGKTTTLRMIAGFHEPDEGTIWLGERRLNELPAHRRGTAMVFQDYALFPHLTVRGNVAYGLRVAGIGGAERAERVAETLDFVGLSELGERYPSQLSGGQQQRVALARALIIRPEVLLLDEPLSNLDARLREQLRWELRSLQQRLGMTFVYVTHDQQEALSMSDWVAVMNRGRVEQAGTPWEIYHRPRTEFLAGFVGSVNLVPSGAAPGYEGPAGTLCIRPEAVRMGGGGGGLRMEGVIERSAFLGDRIRYWVRCGEREWLVDQSDPGTAAPLSGAVTLRVAADRVHVIQPGPSI